MTHPPGDAPRVVRLAAGKGDRIVVELDDGRTLDLAAEAVLQAGLRTGDPLDAALEARLGDTDLRIRAREAALSLLAVRPRSRRELADRLRRKEFPRPVVEACLDALEAGGWLDDAAFARSLVRDRLRLRPRGPGRMAQELRSRGVADPVAQEAVRRVFDEEGVAVPALALDVARGWLRRQSDAVGAALVSEEFGPEREKARRRLNAFLARRGFTGAAARGALEALVRESRDG